MFATGREPQADTPPGAAPTAARRRRHGAEVPKKRNGGGSHRPPKDNPERRRQAGARERRVYSLALNSTWILRGSLTDAVYGTPTDADRVLSEVT